MSHPCLAAERASLRESHRPPWYKVWKKELLALLPHFTMSKMSLQHSWQVKWHSARLIRKYFLGYKTVLGGSAPENWYTYVQARNWYIIPRQAVQNRFQPFVKQRAIMSFTKTPREFLQPGQGGTSWRTPRFHMFEPLIGLQHPQKE